MICLHRLNPIPEPDVLVVKKGTNILSSTSGRIPSPLSDIVNVVFPAESFLAPITTSQVGIFNVTFEPGCRNNWHIHHAKSGGGQILVCVAGRGYYQVEGKEAVEMKPGDCINIPAEVKHWHGAAPDEWFSHLAIEVPGENSSNEWLLTQLRWIQE